MLFVACVNFATSQNCGTSGVCTTDYDAACPEDLSNDLPNCMQSQALCNEPLQAPANMYKQNYDYKIILSCVPNPLLSCRSVQCYSTCIIGAPFDPLVPFQCCADPILDQPLSQTAEPSYTLIRLYSPNAPGEDNYQLNTVCK